MDHSLLKIQFLIFTICCFLFVAPSVIAARLYLESAKEEYSLGETFIVSVRIDTEECINVVEGNLNFSNDILEVVDFSKGESILTLWLKEPTINQKSGLVSFMGGIPGGYCGRIAGDPGLSNLLGKLILRIPGLVVGETKENIAEIKFLESSQVFLNDGLGTKAELKTEGISFKILTEGAVSDNEWQEEITKDNVPPESFEIEIHQDPNIFEGKYFIVFSTTDKQTGIDHYEISEGKTAKEENWKKGDSPYLLEDQNLLSIIKVKAADKAGNERVTEYLPQKNPFSYWIIIIVVGVILIAWYIYNLKKKIVSNTKK
jgi:hypothetical protein